jgi:adenosylcobinamide-GDP ribazoletransferase
VPALLERAGARLAHELRCFLLALQFLTRIPVTGRLAEWVGYSPDLLRASARYFPLVGALLGLLTASVLALAWCALPTVAAAAWVAALLALAAGLLLTGALHEDGLADTFDGLGGSAQRERALEIMKDSRLGSYGALALVLSLLLKGAVLASLLQSALALALLALVWGHTVSRCAPLCLLYRYRHVGDLAGAKSKPLADGIGRMGLLWACAQALALLLVSAAAVSAWADLPWGVLLLALLAALLGAAGGAFVLARWLLRRLGGYTGDGLGATQQAAEIGLWLALLLAVAPRWP